MSKFNEHPYIETILAEVSGQNKAKLLNFINGKSADGTGSTSFTLVSSAEELANLSAGITPVAYKYTSKITWKGYFIKTTNYSSFITFKTGLDLILGALYKVTSSGISFIEDISADNIRTLLREDSYIDSTELPESGSTVIANPTLAGTESALTGLQIDGTKYKVDNDKVAKSNLGNKLYGTLDQGQDVSDAMYSIGLASADAYSIAQRDGNGQIVVPLVPTADNHSASKSYVDNAVSSASSAAAAAAAESGGGGTQLYLHEIVSTGSNVVSKLKFITNSSEKAYAGSMFASLRRQKFVYFLLASRDMLQADHPLDVVFLSSAGAGDLNYEAYYINASGQLTSIKLYFDKISGEQFKGNYTITEL